MPADRPHAADAARRLAGRRLLVVGAGTRPSAHADGADVPVGNGRAIAVAAAREGAAVACADIDAAAAETTAALVKAEGGLAAAITADATDAEASAGMVAEAVRALGGLDALVVNVGMGRGGGLSGTTPEDWDAVFALNMRAHFLAAKHALPELAEGGAIVFVGSLAGLRPGTRSPAYDASKAGLFGLNRQVAVEAARRGVRANVVVPGLIDTPMGRDASAGRPSRTASFDRIPLRRPGSAWEVADAVTFLLSDRAAYITGQSLVVDGGLGMA